MSEQPVMSDKATAAVKQIAHTGAQSFQLRYCDEAQPTIWVGVAEYELEGRTYYKMGVSISPDQAVLNLLDDVIDGGMCTHCGKPAGVESEHELDMPMSSLICWYQFDPELKKFRRSCEGDAQ